VFSSFELPIISPIINFIASFIEKYPCLIPKRHPTATSPKSTPHPEPPGGSQCSPKEMPNANSTFP